MIILGVEEEKIWVNKQYENNRFKYVEEIDRKKITELK